MRLISQLLCYSIFIFASVPSRSSFVLVECKTLRAVKTNAFTGPKSSVLECVIRGCTVSFCWLSCTWSRLLSKSLSYHVTRSHWPSILSRDILHEPLKISRIVEVQLVALQHAIECKLTDYAAWY